MKKPGLFAIETVVALALLLIVLGVLFVYRGAIGDKINQLRGKNVASTSMPTATPTSLITPLPTSTFPAPGATAEPGSITQISGATPTPTPIRYDANGNPLPTTGPEGMVVLIALLAAGAAFGTFKLAKRG